MNYYIEPFGPDQVKIHEDAVSYPMTRTQAEDNLKHIRSHRENYASDIDWWRQVNFYEEILAAMQGRHE